MCFNLKCFLFRCLAFRFDKTQIRGRTERLTFVKSSYSFVFVDCMYVVFMGINV